MIGRIIKLIAGDYTVKDLTSNDLITLKPLGIFRHQKIDLKVGDIVDYNQDNITKCYPRKNDLQRPSVCNIDKAVVVISLKEPSLNLNLLDRFLVLFEYNDIIPIIVFTKKDLLNEEELVKANEISAYYEKIGYDCFLTSKFEEVSKELKDLLRGSLSVATGDSGVGKSSLIKLIDPTLNLKTNEISKALNRGKHTTRHTEIIYIDDIYIVDTPGFGNLSFQDMTNVNLSQMFVEFFEASPLCKYNGCLHVNEPNCEIKKLVKEKVILPSRYENYLSFVEEIKNNKKW